MMNFRVKWAIGLVALLLISALAGAQPVADSAKYDEVINELTIYFDSDIVTDPTSVIFDGILIDDDNGMQNEDLALRGGTVANQSASNSTLIIKPMFEGVVDEYIYNDAEGTEITAQCWGMDYDDMITLETGLNHDDMRLYVPEWMVIDTNGDHCAGGWVPLRYVGTDAADEVKLTAVIYNAATNMLHFEFDKVMQYDQLAEDIAGEHPYNDDWPGPGNGYLDNLPDEDRNGSGVLDMEQNVKLVNISFTDSEGNTFAFASALDVTNQDSVHLTMELSLTKRAAFEQLVTPITVSFGYFTFVDVNYNTAQPVEDVEVTFLEDEYPLHVDRAEYDLGVNDLRVWFDQTIDSDVASYIIMPKIWVYAITDYDTLNLEDDLPEDFLFSDTITVDGDDKLFVYRGQKVFVSGGIPGSNGTDGIKVTMNVQDSRTLEDFYFYLDDAEFKVYAMPNAVISDAGNGNVEDMVDLDFVAETSSNKAPEVDSVAYDAFTNRLYVTFDVRLDVIVHLDNFSIVMGEDEISLTGGEFVRAGGNKALLIDVLGFDQNNIEMNSDRTNATLSIIPFSVFQQNKMNGNRAISGESINYIPDPNPPLPKYVFYNFRESCLVLETQPTLPVLAVDLTKLTFAGVTLSAADSVVSGADSIVWGDTDRLIFYLNSSNADELNSLSDDLDAIVVNFGAGFLTTGDGVESEEHTSITDLTHLTGDSNEVDVLIGYGSDFIVRGLEYFPTLPRWVHASIRKVSEHANWYVANDQWEEINRLNGILHYNDDTGELVNFPSGVVPMNMAQVDSAVKYFEESIPKDANKGAYDKIVEIIAGSQAHKIPDKIDILFADIYDDYGEYGRNDSKAELWQPGYVGGYSNDAELIIVDCYPQNFNDPEKVVYKWDNQNGEFDIQDAEDVNDGLGAIANLFAEYVTYKVDIYEDAWVRRGLAYLAEFLVGRLTTIVESSTGEDSTVVVDQPTFYGAKEAKGISGNNTLSALGADHNSRVDYTYLYMFFLYLWEKYGGDDVITEIAESPRNGSDAINAVINARQDELSEYLKGKDFDDILLDFATANLLDAADPEAGDHGIYEFENINTRGPVRGSQFKWKTTAGSGRAPYQKDCPILGFSYNYTSYGPLDPNNALDPANDNLVVFAGSDAEGIMFRKVNVRASNTSPNLGDEYKIQDFTLDTLINRGELTMSPGGDWTMGLGDDDFPMWILISAGGGDFTVTNESAVADFSSIFVAQNPALSRRLDLYVISELPIYNEEAEASPILYATDDPSVIDTLALVMYSTPDDFELTSVENDMGRYNLYLAGGWMPDPGTYYWHLDGYYPNGVPVEAEDTWVVVNRLPSSEPGELNFGDEVRLNTTRYALSRPLWANIATIPDMGAANSLAKAPSLPEDEEHIAVGHTFRILPAGTVLDDPAILTIRYDKDLAGDSPLGIYYLYEGAWEYVGGVIDTENGTISTRIARFGTYSAMTGEHGDIPDDLLIPTQYGLDQNYPNPFNPTTTIGFKLPRSGHVNLFVYDILGRRVARLVDSHMRFGTHRIIWDGKSEQGVSLASGMYFVRLKAGDFAGIRKMVLVK